MLSPAGQAYVFAIRDGIGPNPTDGYSGGAYLPVTPAALSGGDGSVSGGQSIRLYIGAGDYPQILISRSGGTSSIANGECHYVGYYEDVP